MSYISLNIDELLDRMNKCESLDIYEYYDGYHISFDDVEKFLLKFDENEDVQSKIFGKLNKLEKLKIFKYTTRFPSEMDYKQLQVNENLKNLHISHMENIGNVKQLGNIEFLFIERSGGGFNCKCLELLPNSLKKIDIMSLDIESKEEYDKVVEYFSSRNIEYYFDDFSNWYPKNE